MIDQHRHEVQVSGQNVALTLTEFRILTALAAAHGRVLSRNQLIDQILGIDAIVTDRTIDVHLTALRRKLGPARKHIQTVRGLGYKLADEDETA
jgi:DNA-binding response OmpR family regulator